MIQAPCAGPARALSVRAARRFVVLAWLAACPAWAQHEVERLLEQVLSANPAVKAAAAQKRGADLDVDVARLQRWPAPSISTETAGVNGKPASFFIVDQPLWTAGEITARIKSAELTSEAAQAHVAATQLQTALRLVDAWQSLQSAHGSLRAQENALQRFERYASMMRRRVDAQVSAAIELGLLSTRVLQVQTAADESRALQRVAMTRLAQLAGRELTPSQVEGLVAPADSRAPMEDWARTQTLERLLAELPSAAPVRKAKLEAEAALERLNVQEAQQWPHVSARYQRQLSGDSPTSAQGKDRLWVGLTYAPGAGFSSFSQTRADAQRQLGLAESAEVASQDYTEALRVDWENLRRQLERQNSLQQAIAGATEVLDSYERQFIAGRKTWLDVLNALRELNQGEVSLAEARAGAAAAYYRLRSREWPGAQ